MRKQGYVHLHALLGAVAEHLDDREDAPEVTLSAYDAVAVHPTSLAASKDDHREAMLALAEDVGRSIREDGERPDLPAP